MVDSATRARPREPSAKQNAAISYRQEIAGEACAIFPTGRKLRILHVDNESGLCFSEKRGSRTVSRAKARRRRAVWWPGKPEDDEDSRQAGY